MNFFKIFILKKKISRQQKSMKNYPVCNELIQQFYPSDPPMATRSQTQQKQQTVHEQTTSRANDKDVGCRNDGSKTIRNQEKNGVNSNCIPSLLNLNLETSFIQGSAVTHPNRKRCSDDSLDPYVSMGNSYLPDLRL